MWCRLRPMYENHTSPSGASPKENKRGLVNSDGPDPGMQRNIALDITKVGDAPRGGEGTTRAEGTKRNLVSIGNQQRMGYVTLVFEFGAVRHGFRNCEWFGVCVVMVRDGRTASRACEWTLMASRCTLMGIDNHGECNVDRHNLQSGNGDRYTAVCGNYDGSGNCGF